MKKLLILLLTATAFAQNPQTSTAPIFSVNSRYVQGAGIGYWPTPGTGLVLNIAAGRSRCNNAMVSYVGGTLTLTDNATNYVYLDSGASCVPADNTTGYRYTSAFVNLATVVTSGGAIVSITDDRTFGISGSQQSIDLTGVTGTITGTVLSGTCDSGTASVTGAVVGHPVAVSSTTGAVVGAAFNLRASVTTTGTVTVYVCGTGTPASLAYNVTVF